MRILPALTIAFAMLVTSCSSIDDSVEGKITCKYFGRTDQTLAIRTDDDDLIRLVDMNFRVSPFVPTILSCRQWMDGLDMKDILHKKWSVRPTISENGIKEGRLIDEERERLYVNCHRSPLCQVRFPYNLGLWRISEMFEPESESPFGLSEGLCQTAIAESQVEKLELSEIEPIGADELKDMETWSSPPVNFADEVIKLIHGARSGTIFISTMTVYSEDIEKIVAELGEQPLLSIYLLFDASSNITAYDINQWMPYASDQIHFVPIAPRPDRPTFYHLKGAAATEEPGRFVFTSLNLTDNSDATILDLGFSATSKNVAAALSKVFVDEIEKACREPEYLECTLNARTSPDYIVRHELRAALADSCRDFYIAGLPNKFRDVKNPYFLTTDRVDIVSTFKDLINGSKKSVAAYSHRVDSWPVLFAIEEAGKRGVDVSVYAGRMGDHPIRDKFKGMLSSLQDKAQGDAHAKFILIDDEKALWGTGNFTKNGLSDAAEYFFLTDHPKLIEALGEYAAFWNEALKALPPPAPANTQQKP